MAGGPILPLTLAAAASSAARAFDLSLSDIGLFSGYSFVIACVTSVLMSRWVDGLSLPVGIVMLQGVSLAALCLPAFWPSQGSLIAGLTLAGLAMGLANPVTNRLIADYVRPRWRGMLVGLKQAGIPAAQLLVGTVMVPLAAAIGIEKTLLISGAIALPAMFLLFVKPTGASQQQRAHPPARTRGKGRTGRLTAFSFFTGAGTQGVIIYLASYAYHDAGLSETLAGALVATVGLASLLGRPYWGHRIGEVSDLSWPIRIVVSGAIVAVALIAAVQLLPSSISFQALAVACLLLGVTGAASNAVAMAAVVQRSEPGELGRASAYVSGALFAGFAAGPAVNALMITVSGFTAAWVAAATMYLCAGLAVRGMR